MYGKAYSKYLNYHVYLRVYRQLIIEVCQITGEHSEALYRGTKLFPTSSSNHEKLQIVFIQVSHGVRTSMECIRLGSIPGSQEVSKKDFTQFIQ